MTVLAFRESTLPVDIELIPMLVVVVVLCAVLLLDAASLAVEPTIAMLDVVELSCTVLVLDSVAAVTVSMFVIVLIDVF